MHIVQPGDTIFGLALRYNVPVEQIYELNGLNARSLLSIGQELIIGVQRSMVALSTATPQPALTATPPLTIVPSLSLASSSDLPAFAQDLLYIRDGWLMRWNHLNGQQEVLAGPGSSSSSISALPVS